MQFKLGRQRTNNFRAFNHINACKIEHFCTLKFIQIENSVYFRILTFQIQLKRKMYMPKIMQCLNILCLKNWLEFCFEPSLIWIGRQTNIIIIAFESKEVKINHELAVLHRFGVRTAIVVTLKFATNSLSKLSSNKYNLKQVN